MFRLQIAPGLEIRSFAQSDAAALWDAVERNRARLREWLPWVDGTRSAADLALFIERSAAQEDAHLGAQTGIWLDGALAGSIGCHPIDWKNRSTSIGYWLDAAHQGKGVITRCTEALLNHLFFELRLHRVEIRCATGNRRSCAIPAGLGFEREGIARDAEWVNDRFLDLVVWSMLAPQWRQRG
jgi:ribosomal-protein-serine acetyltransferase